MINDNYCVFLSIALIVCVTAVNVLYYFYKLILIFLTRIVACIEGRVGGCG